MMEPYARDSKEDMANLVMVDANDSHALHPYMDPKREVTKALCVAIAFCLGP